ncbi:carboxypeptidase-like regulatory domain-containing protein [Psychroflexus sp. ALD_RP9]|uniref:carboxypeptidase-like regulatory domain-containing protein n=1 Tax=Psychroflexus sp. ALD_RP9 TaxID=2777186 RepID=UPI001A9056F4|nr:carboxypeptidase-like regulatory domain-containing protein [Psychroflexus sp. ALD_RP9]QSS97218.1 carboxypeptidase-like regulatory domain-containing protein [Psychroflexus sp. ALD_RP9]
MKVLVKIAVFCFVSISILSCGSDTNMIKGKVVNQQDEALDGVLIQVVGTDLYAKSKANGQFLINTKQRGDELLFKKEGYQIKFVKVKASTENDYVIKLLPQ